MVALVLCLQFIQAPAPASAAPELAQATPIAVNGRGSPTVSIPRIDARVAIDGQLDEPAWSKAVRLSGFSEYRPVDGQPASELTEVLVWYSPTALHFGIIAHDAMPGAVRATVADRDTLDRDDSIRIYLDTFNDKRRAFVFGVNPLGVQEDGVQTEGAFNAGRMFGGTVDLSPDYQFDSKGRLTPDGYVVEVRIPFKSLRYSGGGPQRWGLNFLRKVQRTGREDTWTDAKRIASFLAQAGTIEGLHDLQRGTVTELQPFVTASSNGALAADRRYEREPIAVGPGANLRLGFTNVSLDATVNPDFSQVESDATQVTVNERFALFYTEKRPFFLEGIELFATPNQLVYTRRIVDPTAGGKFTGKVGRVGLAYLSAADDTGQRHAWFNVARVRRDFGANSLAGLTYTDRTDSNGFNRVLAADARIVFSRLYYVLGQLGGSWTDAAGYRTRSPMWHAEFDRTARTWGFNYRIVGFGESFQTQSGFVPRNNMVDFHAFNRLTYYGRRGSLIENFTTFLGPTRVWTYGQFGHGGAIEGNDSANLTGQLRGGWSVNARIGRDIVNFDPRAYSAFGVQQSDGSVGPYDVSGGVVNWSGTYSVTTPVFRRVNGKLEIKNGGTAIFAEASDGRERRVTATVNVRPTASIRIETGVALSRIRRDRDGEAFARTTIPRLKLEYQPRRSLFVRLITEYRSEWRAPLEHRATGAPIVANGTLADTQQFTGLRMDWLVSFEPTPGTVAFFGYGSSLDQDRSLNPAEFRRTADGFFVKLAYMLRR